jgi:hypothetical protein
MQLKNQEGITKNIIMNVIMFFWNIAEPLSPLCPTNLYDSITGINPYKTVLALGPCLRNCLGYTTSSV